MKPMKPYSTQKLFKISRNPLCSGQSTSFVTRRILNSCVTRMNLKNQHLAFSITKSFSQVMTAANVFQVRRPLSTQIQALMALKISLSKGMQKLKQNNKASHAKIRHFPINFRSDGRCRIFSRFQKNGVYVGKLPFILGIENSFWIMLYVRKIFRYFAVYYCRVLPYLKLGNYYTKKLII